MLLKIVKVTKDKGSQRSCHRPEKTGEAWQPNYNLIPGLGLKRKDSISEKLSEIQVKSEVELVVVGWCQFHSSDKCTMLMQNVNNERNWVRLHDNSVHLPLFCKCEIKTK